MSRGEYSSLEKARKKWQAWPFAEEHPSKADRDRFERLIHVLDYGRTLAEGPPGEVLQDPRVIAAYAGTAMAG
jgi:Branched-chain amino acid ATP-binding cassette transporter